MKEKIKQLLWEAYVLGFKMGNQVDRIAKSTKVHTGKDSINDVTEADIDAYIMKYYFDDFLEWYNPDPKPKSASEKLDEMFLEIPRNDNKPFDLPGFLEPQKKTNPTVPEIDDWGITKNPYNRPPTPVWLKTSDKTEASSTAPYKVEVGATVLDKQPFD